MALRKGSFNITTPENYLQRLIEHPRDKRLEHLTRLALSNHTLLISLENYLKNLDQSASLHHNADLASITEEIALAFKTTYILKNNYYELNEIDREQFLRAWELHSDIEMALILLNRCNDLEKNLENITNDLRTFMWVPSKTLDVIEYLTQALKEYPAQKLVDFLQTLAIDPITQDIMQDPVITPLGHTYSEDTLKKWFGPGNDNHICPISKNNLHKTDLIPNHLVSRALRKIRAGLRQENFEEIKKQLICPLTNLFFIEPCVAADGETYERRAIEAYLDKHENKTPHGIEQDKPLYPNFIIRDLLSAIVYSEEQLKALTILNNYLTQVSKEPDELLGWLGVAYTKQQKSETTIKLMKVVMGNEPADIFWTDGKIRSILEQGRAAEAAKPAFNYLQQIRVH